MTNPIRAAIAVFLASTCAACTILSPQKDTTRFAVLASIDELPGEAAPTSQPSDPQRSVGLGPVELPDYVRRSAMVTRVAGTHILTSDTERWAESLDRSVERVLALDLARLLGVARVTHYPWYESERPDVQVQVTFTRFEREESGRVVAAGRWSVRSLSTTAPPIESEFRKEIATSGSDGASTALALSQALADLSREIAAAWPHPAGN